MNKDVDEDFKKRLFDRLYRTEWNRYPNADLASVEILVANYCGLQTEQIVVGAGSATIITTLLNYFAINQKRIVIAQPGYSLFDYHCKTYGIPYEPWLLTLALEFDFENLPPLDEKSVLMITSPNNPTGNTIREKELKELLIAFPQSLIVLDAVYTEFSDADHTRLINDFSNLIVLRSFSKAFPVAGLRIGYLCAQASLTALIRNLMLPFALTPFSQLFAQEVLFDAAFQKVNQQKVRDIMLERELLSNALSANFPLEQLKVYPSQGNFLLVHIADPIKFDACLQAFSEAGIKVLNTSNFVLLNQTFRVTVSDEFENELFLKALQNGMRSSTAFYLN